jgi:hypothetical protein
MATLTCNNKGCYKTTSDSLLDEATNEIICSECNQPITNISDFTKRSMKGLGFVKKEQGKPAFSIDCKECGRRGQPIFKNKVPCCFMCKKELKLTDQFIKMLKEHFLREMKDAKEDAK